MFKVIDITLKLSDITLEVKVISRWNVLTTH